MISDARSLPVDETSASDLAARGLAYRQVEGDGADFDHFLQAVSRGFLDEAPTDAQIADSRDALSERRLVGVFDPAGAHPERPVATVDSWPTELTVRPDSTLAAWAISAVTVAPTHRRRGIASALITGELRTARAAGFPVAALTVTEATIYGRWGFSPAVFTADVKIDTARAGWAGPHPQGRLDFIDQAEIPARLGALHERARLQRPGQVRGWPGLWRRTAGLRPGADDTRKIRAVVYRDRGEDRGILVYVLGHGEGGFARHVLEVRTLVAVDDDATAALWKYAIEHDLVASVTASLQPVDAPVRWLVADRRAVTVEVTDHEWLRILDLPRVLEARAYPAPAAVTLAVADPLGYAEGTWDVRIADGRARVTPTDGPADVHAGVGEVASALLGGVSWNALAAAGRVRGDARALGALDAAFAAPVPPTLGIWY
jgi:predicted acetyltransferase